MKLEKLNELLQLTEKVNKDEITTLEQATEYLASCIKILKLVNGMPASKSDSPEDIKAWRSKWRSKAFTNMNLVRNKLKQLQRLISQELKGVEVTEAVNTDEIKTSQDALKILEKCLSVSKSRI